MEANVFIQLGISMMLGLLVGLQRERTQSSVAGIRTFPLITTFGTVCGWLAVSHGGWTIAAGTVVLGAVLFAAKMARIKSGDTDPGLTTEIAVLVLFGVGACVATGPMAAAVTLGGAVAVLLHLKNPLHKFVATIGEADMRAIMQFVVVTLVILPVLPNKAFGPFNVFNPFKIWLFVILIVGMSLCGYVLFKLISARAGVWLAGTLGGVISSTATTFSYARGGYDAGPAALVIMLASTILYLRLLVILAAVAPGNFLKIAPPVIAMLIACALLTGAAALLNRKKPFRISPPKNPAQLQSALIFGAIYAVIRFGTAAAKNYFGIGGLYTVAVIGGATDVDAVTLSIAQQPEAGLVWRAILLATTANLVFKAGIVGVLGGRELLLRIGILFGLALLAGGAILWLWPQEDAG